MLIVPRKAWDMQPGKSALSGPRRAYLAPVFAEVDATISRLARKQFSIDPIVEVRYSLITSIVSSAYKRHGELSNAHLLRLLDRRHT